MNRRQKSEKGSVVVAQSEAWRQLVAGRPTQNSGFNEEHMNPGLKPRNGRWATKPRNSCSAHGFHIESRISCYKLLKLSHLSIHIMYRLRSTSFNIIKHHFK
ncbi:hypothetical protein QL285_057366 [Trifolium repens]|nr:hypothetical protein QL285_057366 [Trifolium repens]